MVLTLTNLMRGVDITAIDRLRLKYPRGPNKNPSWLKFLDWRHHGRIAIRRMAALRLVRPEPQDVLDVGCACGYTVRAAACLGHRAVGLDIPDPFYAEAWEIMGVNAIPHALVVGEPLPESLGTYDVICMFGFGLPRVRVDGRPLPKEEIDWSLYRALLLQLLGRLRTGGLFYVQLNYGRQWLFHVPSWQQLARDVGGTFRCQANCFQIRKNQ